MLTKTIIFDQYSRYKACADLLIQVGIGEHHTILDIGSGPERLFGKFVPDTDICFVDPLIPADEGSGSISGDVFTAELDGASFDCVCSVDVFEHVPPEVRDKFLERLSSLATDIIILGFPSSDTPGAKEVDDALEGKYREVYATDYSWLEEHNKYGLPSLDDTVERLKQLGWSCQTVGHGYAPWLKDLLSIVINAWEIPGLRNIVLDLSEKFNCNLYQYDYGEPSYRQFIIASRSALPAISVPAGAHNNVIAQNKFRDLLKDAQSQFYVESLRLLSKIESQSGLTGTSADEHAALIKDRDAAEKERDTAVAELELAEHSLNIVKASRSWRLTRPLRVISRFSRHGLVVEDQQRVSQALRRRYHLLPIPGVIKRIISFVYHNVFRKGLAVLRRKMLRAEKFQAPLIKPSAQLAGLDDYIFWGVVDWHFRHQRPQQLAQALVNTGRRVIYISPVLIDDNRAGFEVESLDDSGLLFQVRLFAKGSPAIYTSVPGLETIDQLRKSVGEVLDWMSAGKNVSFVQHPFWCDIAAVLPNSCLVYDCMDHHEGFGNTAESLVLLEKTLLMQSDLTITTSEWLYQVVAEHSKRHALIRNAGEYSHFSVAPDSIYSDPEGRRIIGYYGAIADWFDLDLVETVAEKYPECSVLLIGADTVNAQARLAKLHNVIFVGEVAYDKLPFYLYSFDVCMLPFKVIPLTVATNPVKAYEYLSAGKPVVTVDLPEMAQFDELVYVASNHNDFIEMLGKTLDKSESDSSIQRRKDFAAGQTWQHRIDELIKVVDLAGDEPSVSVIVVTYNNLDLTKVCLSSIDERSLYENLEVIVVDNASSDGSQEYLQQWAKQGENRELILNNENLGFAAANNQGLIKASGDFLVLLNNDTYVTPGWVRTLVRHLQRDNTIGLIGPVTNNIGNEAKIDIQYDEMGEMLGKASTYTYRHIGQLYPLNTAAFFCVMMSRKTYQRTGLLDEEFGRGFFEDDDYCRRIELNGLRVVCAEDVFVHHNLSASFNKLNDEVRQELFEKNKAIYEKKWGAWLPHSYRRNIS